jgi:hypothetical protein
MDGMHPAAWSLPGYSIRQASTGTSTGLYFVASLPQDS